MSANAIGGGGGRVFISLDIVLSTLGHGDGVGFPSFDSVIL